MAESLAASRRDDPYRRFARLDGSHPLRRAVPRGFVDYRARRIPGEVVYFNFELAREMGLIPADHPDRLVPALRRAILDAFSIRIVNEYDEAHGLEPDSREAKPGRYMATRYLQLQHPGRSGRTSGDGRSVWLGTVEAEGGAWDVSACGTGSTRLCPGTALTGRHYKTGSRRAAYGCGTASLFEGISAAVLSESFRLDGIATERVLAVIETGGGLGVTVRAYPSLLRPAHFFVWLKQRDLASLRGAAELYWSRLAANGAVPALSGAARWERLAEDVARSFARAAATFESEYVFCWLAWDGDNILMDGAVLDYGSVRRFGLYHREYRYDDGPRWSTSIPEQRREARRIVQAFAQVRDALTHGALRPLSAFRRDRAVRRFDAEFERWRSLLLLRGIGMTEATAAAVLRDHPRRVARFRRSHRYFERAASRRRVAVSDGVTRNAVYSTRDVLRELPAAYLREERTLGAGEFLGLAASTYASRRDRRASRRRSRHAHAFQREYLALLAAAAELEGKTFRSMLREVAARSATVNRFARITGDACIDAASRLVRARRRLGVEGLYAAVHAWAVSHASNPDAGEAFDEPAAGTEAHRVVEALRKAAGECRHGL